MKNKRVVDRLIGLKVTVVYLRGDETTRRKVVGTVLRPARKGTLELLVESGVTWVIKVERIFSVQLHNDGGPFVRCGSDSRTLVKFT